MEKIMYEYLRYDICITIMYVSAVNIEAIHVSKMAKNAFGKCEYSNGICLSTLFLFPGGSNCDLFRSHVTGSNDATLGEVG
jgi:hypothetical protein